MPIARPPGVRESARLLLQVSAGVGVDLGAESDLDNLRGLPGHPILQFCLVAAQSISVVWAKSSTGILKKARFAMQHCRSPLRLQ